MPPSDVMGWIAYVIAWIAAALFWTMASAAGVGRSPTETLPFGLLAMGSAGLLGVGVWRLTDRVAWDWRAPSFYAYHGAALVVFAAGYSTSWVWPDLVMGRFREAITAIRSSPIMFWNLLMATWLYLVIAGLSYAIRSQRRLRSEEAAAAEARVLAQQAQLAALRAQINPHFLFNALHTVGALIAIDPQRADAALECLGDLLRYALGAEDEVPFRQEWRFTKDYLAFEQLRLGDRLRIDEVVDEEAHAVLVPPLILQPLVENAVRHGIADRPDGGLIALSARVTGPQLLLNVTDDGNGAHAAGATLAGTGPGGAGLGMESVRRRLTAMYGSRATLSVDRRATGFSVTIGLPLQQTDADVAQERAAV